MEYGVGCDASARGRNGGVHHKNPFWLARVADPAVASGRSSRSQRLVRLSDSLPEGVQWCWAVRVRQW